MSDYDDVKSKARDARDKAEKLGRDAQDAAGDFKDRALDFMGNVRDKAGDFGKEAIDKSKQAQDVVCDFIEDSPYKALGIAFLVGICFGKCWSSKKSRRKAK